MIAIKPILLYSVHFNVLIRMRQGGAGSIEGDMFADSEGKTELAVRASEKDGASVPVGSAEDAVNKSSGLQSPRCTNAASSALQSQTFFLNRHALKTLERGDSKARVHEWLSAVTAPPPWPKPPIRPIGKPALASAPCGIRVNIPPAPARPAADASAADWVEYLCHGR